MGSSTPPAPPPPDYAKANREGILTDVETLPVRRQIDIAARMGKSGTYTLDGKEYEYDFAGMSDLDYGRQQRDYQRETADLAAQDFLEIQEKYGTQFLETSREQLKASDPIGFALRENMGKEVTKQLAMGGAATDDELRQVQQRVRANQSRLGNTRGVAAGVQEVMGQTQYQNQRQQQRLGNAGSFLAGTNPLSQFGQLRGAQAGAAPYSPIGTGGTIGVNANAGQLGAQFAQQSFGTQANIYNTQMSNQQANPWMQGLGLVAGAGASYMGAKHA